MIEYLEHRWVVTAILLGIVVAKGGARIDAAVVPPKLEKRIRFIRQGYLSNRESFERYRCTMVLRQGKTVGIAAAVRSGPQRDVVKATATMVVDGPRICYARQSNDRLRPIGPSQGTISIDSSGCLGDGRYFLRAGMTYDVATIRAGAGDADWTTWNGGGAARDGKQGELAFMLEELVVAAKKIPFKIRDNVEVDGHLTTRVEIVGDGKGKVATPVFFVDEQRGFIPLEHWGMQAGKAFQKMFVTDIQHCARDRWFPMRSVTVWISGDEATGEHTVLEIKVTHLEVDYRPRPRDFTLTLPADTQIHDGHNPNSNFVIAAEEEVTLSDLEGLFRRSQQMIKERATRHRALAKESGYGRSIILIANLVVVLGLMIMLSLRWYRGRRSGT